MSHLSKREYLAAIWGRYQRVGRRFRSKILDEFCAVCGYARKYAIRLLKRPLPGPRRRAGPKVRYGAEVVKVLKEIWKHSEWMCSKRLRPALALWLPYYERRHGELPMEVRRLVLRVSSATIDRLLRPTRRRWAGRGCSGTRPGLRLKLKVPIRRGTHRCDRPGLLEMDTVPHCGDHLSGDFVWTLTATDLCSQWTENRAVWNKGATDVLRQVQDMEAHLPFVLWGIDVDNGSEFLNHHLYRYCHHHQPRLELTRSRPAYKNDQAHAYTALALPPGSKLWSKAGYTSECRHDAACVELPNGAKSVLVTFTMDHANEREIIPTVAKAVIENFNAR